MNANTNETPTPQCTLCGCDCWFDDRKALRFVGALIAWFGVFLLPLGFIALFEWTDWCDEMIGAPVGLAIYALIVAYLFTRPCVWVCVQCGAYFPARSRSEHEGIEAVESDTRAQGAETNEMISG